MPRYAEDDDHGNDEPFLPRVEYEEPRAGTVVALLKSDAQLSEVIKRINVLTLVLMNQTLNLGHDMAVAEDAVNRL